ncbi:hypothetical protein BgiBS90_018632, partial [Biomphalaria glabrata]
MLIFPRNGDFPTAARGRFSTFSSAISRHYLYIQNTKGSSVACGVSMATTLSQAARHFGA